MVVDDEPDTVEVLSTLIEILGYEPRVAKSGKEAIELASVFDPHVVLLDIALPDMSGYDVVQQLRADTARRRFMVAATGYALERDRVRALEAGFDQHLPKPATVQKVREVMQIASRYV